MIDSCCWQPLWLNMYICFSLTPSISFHLTLRMMNTPTIRTERNSEKEAKFLAATVSLILMDLFAPSSIRQTPWRFVGFSMFLQVRLTLSLLNTGHFPGLSDLDVVLWATGKSVPYHVSEIKPNCVCGVSAMEIMYFDGKSNESKAF